MISPLFVIIFAYIPLSSFFVALQDIKKRLNIRAVKRAIFFIIVYLILTAINQGVVKSQELAEKHMQEVTGNLLGNIKLPGM